MKDKPIKKTKKRGYFLYNFVKITGSPTLLWMRPKVLSIGNTKPKNIKGGAIIAANHNSFCDPIFCLCVFWRRPLHFIATKDLYRTKIMNFFLRHVHCIQVDKENFSMACFHEVKEVLEEDKLVMIYPEGGINVESNELLSFKSGAILMAHKANKPIIPMYIVKGKKWYNRWHCVMGDPVDVRALCGQFPTLDKINQISDLLKEKEEELKNYYMRSKKK
ncbi:MAG: 1-acyl-sn-glycerol-3-phosphate acyltransferase [Clostridia bacterium]|nr:1-acyl-sn-glycerol-3-phosphate acyltransferase [Clostridia bacterium]